MLLFSLILSSESGSLFAGYMYQLMCQIILLKHQQLIKHFRAGDVCTVVLGVIKCAEQENHVG